MAGNKDDRGVGPSFVDRFLHAVEHWKTFVRGATFARRHSTDDLCPVLGAGLGVKRSFAAGQALHDYAR